MILARKPLNKMTTMATALGLLGLLAAPFLARANEPAPQTEILPAYAAADIDPLSPPTGPDTQHHIGQTFSGNYLAARFAQRQQDWQAAQHYMNAVTRFDAGNELMAQRAFLLSLGAGKYDVARHLAQTIIDSKQGSIEPALIFMASDAMVRNEFERARELISRLPDDGFGQYTKPLMTAWALAGMGQRDAAIAHLLEYSDASDPTYNLHVGMMYDMAGEAELAAKHFTAALESEMTLHSALLLSDFFERQGYDAAAKKLKDGIGPLYALPAGGTPLRIRRPADGAAVAMFDLATMLFERRSFDSAQIYAQLVNLLSPRSDFAGLMLGDIAAINEHYAKAADSYRSIAESSPLHLLARMRTAEAYENAGYPDHAVGILQELASLPQARMPALTAIGDMQRRREHFTEAVAAYDAALSGIEQPEEAHWAIVYARGMSLERAQDWTRAEKDLLLALSFQPDNPMILNYIGYSWVDKGVNLPKAMDFISRAVALRPDDGYILDSYGWAYYRLGNMEKAVEWLEKSVALVPDDSTILDHLADAYFQIGRETEARFKWQRARELSRDADFRASVERKIQRGIEPAAATAVVQKDASL